MAPPNTTTSGPFPLTPSAAASDWTDFINTVGTSMGPLLLLFGEQPTKQFLSVSMGWPDNIILAVGPIGLITVIVSAIRIGGPQYLKAILGRAREARADAEKEFLSSTSDEICELWSGREIVRVAGKPNDMKSLIILQPWGDFGAVFPQVMDVASAVQHGILDIQPSLPSDLDKEVRDETIQQISLQSPNITLNVRGTVVKMPEMCAWMVVGVLLQVCVVVFPTLTTYYWRWLRKGATISAYAYPLYAAGTVMIFIGVLYCGHVVKSSTTEHTLVPSRETGIQIRQIIRLQMACEVGSQQFKSFAILNHKKDLVIRTSRLNSKSYKTWSGAGSLLALIGFVIQFVGLGGLHWSATLSVLVFSFFMTAMRALIRRGLASYPQRVPIPEKDALAWVALRIARNDWKTFLQKDKGGTLPVTSWDCEWGILTGIIGPWLLGGMSLDNPGFLIGRSANLKHMLEDATNHLRPLAKLSGEEFVVGFCRRNKSKECLEVKSLTDLFAVTSPSWRDCGKIASKLAAAMKGMMGYLGEEVPNSHWKGDLPPWIYFHDFRVDVQQSLGKKTSWYVRTNSDLMNELILDLTVGLSLWIYSLMQRMERIEKLRQAMELPFGYYFEFGRDSFGPEDRGEFVRILGNTGYVSAEEVGSWIPADDLHVGETISVPCYDKINLPTRRQRGWPVFGLYYSTSFKMKPMDQDSVHHERTFIFQEPKDRPDAQDIVTTVMSTLETECALEILSLFMLSICMCLERIDGEPESVGRKLTHTIITGLAEQVVRAGLVDNTPRALLYIVPALAKFGLLPQGGVCL